jgi:hypothetical protein
MPAQWIRQRRLARQNPLRAPNIMDEGGTDKTRRNRAERRRRQRDDTDFNGPSAFRRLTLTVSLPIIYNR